MLDLVIRNGTIVDGTGSPGLAGDLAITGGRIAAIGEVAESGRNEIDATGQVVCPGFVDPHTHYDAQLFWDPAASPSNLHGVTTVIGGNCGFTLAPLNPGDAPYLQRMMAKVEGMPLSALEAGLDWSWRTFGDYLARLDGNLGVNAGFLVGHCAVRRVVMGAEATGNEADPDQLEAMKSLLAEGISAGGLGFSTSLSYTHNDGDGAPVASRFASNDEVIALCSVVAQHEGTTLEYVTDGCMQGFTEEELDLMVAMSRAARRPLNWNVLTIDSADPDRYRAQLGASVRAAERGARVVALTMPVLVGMNMSFLNYCALNMLPDWGEVLGLPVPERMARLADPQTRAHLAERAASPDAGVFTRLTGWGGYRIGDTFSSANEEMTGRTVADIASERGTGHFDTLLDIVLSDELRTVLWPAPTDDDDESWRLRAEAWQSEHTLIGGSDAGAHLDRMCGAPYTTAFLGDCLRGRKLASLETAISMLTDAPARLFGLRERGRIEQGWHADVVVFDPGTVDSGAMRMVEDLPGGSPRLFADAVGVNHVLVNGQSIVSGGRATEARPGTLLRSGRDTDTVLVG
ncbi:N-acyl-D-amino-acid deacylase family protein [Candidatus Poriferisocius sp.]|uniref:N-acyl-D-amino-acid deacylase family protein n=1 Tax=Candidatus Poriferisocius sp. TaxID=3101276 RepID=UPI003B01F6A7